jgi:hypothetical protein
MGAGPAERRSRRAAAIAKGRSAQTRSALAVRITLILVGALAIGWGALLLPEFSQQAVLEQTATHIMRDEAFKTESLLELLPAVEAVERADACDSTSRRSAVIVRLKIVEQLLSSEQLLDLADHQNALRKSARAALACDPVDGFLWLTLFRAELATSGLSDDPFRYLRLSYRLGPNEGWIALKRNYFALGMFEDLPQDLAALALDEFAHLLNNGLYQDVLTLLIGPGWRLRDTLLAHLDGVTESHRRNFALLLRSGGYPAEVPGIVLPRERP